MTCRLKPPFSINLWTTDLKLKNLRFFSFISRKHFFHINIIKCLLYELMHDKGMAELIWWKNCHHFIILLLTRSVYLILDTVTILKWELGNTVAESRCAAWTHSVRYDILTMQLNLYSISNLLKQGRFGINVGLSRAFLKWIHHCDFNVISACVQNWWLIFWYLFWIAPL